MRNASEPGATSRVTLVLGDTERRALIERAAAESVAQGRPVSVSEVARLTLRAGLEAQRSAEAA